jgi:hypothetical protein
VAERWICLKCGRPYGSPEALTCRQGCGSGSCRLESPVQVPLFATAQTEPARPASPPAPPTATTPKTLPSPRDYAPRCPQYAVCVAEGLNEGDCETCPARPTRLP